MNNFLNLFGLGRIKFSATLSSLLALAIFLLIKSNSIKWLIFGILLVISLFYINKKLSDRKEIVIDEFLGMFLALLIANNSSFLVSLSMLILFRIVDNLKFPPFSTVDKKVKGIAGILLDDILIGFVLGIIFLFAF